MLRLLFLLITIFCTISGIFASPSKYTVSIRDKQDSHIISGVIVSPKVILTAGEVTFQFKYLKSVLVGSTLRLNLSKAYAHEEFDLDTMQHNIGILVPERGVDSDSMKFPKVYEYRLLISKDQDVQMFHWGLNKDKQDSQKEELIKLLYKVPTNDECKEKLTNNGIGFYYSWDIMCIEGPKFSVPAYGAPVIYQKELVGIVGSIEPQLFLRLDSYQKWIMEQISKNQN